MAKRKGKKRKVSNYGDAVRYSPNSFAEREVKPAGSAGDDATTEKDRGQDLARERENERLRREALQREKAPRNLKDVFQQLQVSEGVRLYYMKMRRMDMAFAAKQALEKGLGRRLPVKSIEDDIHNASSTTKADVFKDVIGDYRTELKNRANDLILDTNKDSKVEDFEMTPCMRALAKYM